MIKSWILLVLMSTGELQAYRMETELACDRERIEIEALSRMAATVTGPVPVIAQCVHALVDGSEDGE